MAHRYRVHHRHHHRHRNPLGINKASITTGAWAVAGAVGSRALPAMLMAAQNTSWMGYLMNAAASVALKFVGDMFDANAGDGMLIGGFAATGMRIVSDNFGSKIPGLGAYWTSYLPALPANSNPYGQMPDPAAVAASAAAAAAAAAPRSGMSGGRYTGGRFRRQ